MYLTFCSALLLFSALSYLVAVHIFFLYWALHKPRHTYTAVKQNSMITQATAANIAHTKTHTSLIQFSQPDLSTLIASGFNIILAVYTYHSWLSFSRQCGIYNTCSNNHQPIPLTAQCNCKCIVLCSNLCVPNVVLMIKKRNIIKY